MLKRCFACNLYYRVVGLVIGLLMAATATLAQTAAFSYQGRLTDGGNPADAIYDMQFKLFDSADFVTGIQQGATINLPAVEVTNGVFTVQLDFGASVFSGAGPANTTGDHNSFFGFLAGRFTNTGNNNSFFGRQAGQSNTVENDNTLIGALSDGSAGITNATAIGFRAKVTQSNSLVLGSVNGINGATATARVGIGITAPVAKLHIETDTTSSGDNTAFFTALNIGPNPSRIHFGPSGDWYIRSADSSGKVILQDTGGNVGIGTASPADRLQVSGNIRVGTGTTGCVRDADATVIAGVCSSDARLKLQVTPFPSTLAQLVKLRPVHFYWDAERFRERGFGSRLSFGLIAQEVEEVLPELVTEDESGYKAVRYNKLPLLLLQAIKELKAENETLRKELHVMSERLSGLERKKDRTGR